MSNAGQILSAGLGAVIGFVVTGGNPIGALYGPQIGARFSTELVEIAEERSGESQP
jgi:hypothetical protein